MIHRASWWPFAENGPRLRRQMPQVRKHFAYTKVGKNLCEILIFVILKENLSVPFEQKNDEGMEHKGAYPEVERKQFEARLELG